MSLGYREIVVDRGFEQSVELLSHTFAGFASLLFPIQGSRGDIGVAHTGLVVESDIDFGHQPFDDFGLEIGIYQ